ncbi:FAD-dependent oxidoreductase [Undibacterium umbellatum]|uniref:FAD-binding oxidoreductase n=1 Tax=Undibacterium umbellatum TaxID=2762300 RepID=A0ABR6Z4D0_9BURK|nr:FAD-binding protein [Undibacterium umbellatum]MBC3906166.1 FAD-binding oxidoreductase [Undibacterium umbellatum]
MKRRNFLSSLAMAAATTLPPLKLSFGSSLSAKLPYQRVRPTDVAWPDAAKWAKLNNDVGGSLIKVQSLFHACQTEPDGVACLDALKHVGNPYWIGDQPAGTENSGWLDAWTPRPSEYAIQARDSSDVAAGITFARKNKLRLAVKGGGHSYLGTSNAPDSLLIWTRAMNKVTLHDAFVVQGGSGHAAPVPAVSAGAGAMWMDLYQAVTTEGGRYVQGGSCTTVGVAGLVQSGGFNSFSKGFGTAAAGLLEAEIVTADGQVRIVNEFNDADLFWALKGGGGGTFGVITRVTLRTHDLPLFFGGAWGKIKARSGAAFTRLIAHFIAFYHETLFNQHWGEHVHLESDNVLELGMISQGLDPKHVLAIWQPFFDWVTASPDDFAVLSPLGAWAWDARAWWDLDKSSSMERDTREGVPKHHGWGKSDQGEVGIFLHGYDSLWLPASLLQADRQQSLADALFAASRHQMVRLHIGKGLAGAPSDVRAAVLQTTTNPAVVDAFTLVIIAEGERPPAYPGFPRTAVDLAAARRVARDIDLAAAELRKIAPNSGSYVPESNYFNSAWQKEYWGENYSTLRAIKSKYDPEGLFCVHHGVGSEDWSADGFTRFA